MLEVFFGAMEDLDRRRRRPVEPRNPGPLEQHFEHLVGTDPRSSIVAGDGDRIVAFGILSVRGRRGFLSFLFVAPEWQGRGLGRALLAECRRAAGDIEQVATCAEADQPVATGLYASLGMTPRLPIYLLRGALGESSLPELPRGLRARAIDPAAVAGIDADLLDHDRPEDHAFWARHERDGWMLEDATNGLPRGYGYAHRSGRLGPVAAAEPDLLPALLGHLVRSTPVLEGWQLLVPGPAMAALRPLLAAGMRIDGSPAVYCADGGAPRFDRYLPMSFALL